ncbi:type I restriction enzyme endonuclease domain-containing protein, partial [Thiospirillum jenense]
MFAGFNYHTGLNTGLTGSPPQRLTVLAGAVDWILTVQQQIAINITDTQQKRHAQQQYSAAVAALSKAFALTAASAVAQSIRNEIAFFQAVQAALNKTIQLANPVTSTQTSAIAELIDRAIVVTGIDDLLRAAGMRSVDLSIFSDEFLSELQGMEQKALALATLEQLTRGAIREHHRINVVQSRAFSERLKTAIAKYDN